MPWLYLIVIIGLFLLVPTAYAGVIGAPYAPTRLAAVRKAFNLIGLSAEDFVVDLGAGDGSILKEAARRGAGASGYELSPLMWAVARWRNRRNKPVHIHLANFYKKKLPAETTVVFVFLMPKIMGRVSKYLKQQKLPRGKLLLSYMFALPAEYLPLFVIRTPACGPIYVYDLKELLAS